jgi:hypothetical protein
MLSSKCAGVLVAACAIAFASSAPARAGTIDFSGVQGFDANPLVLPEATITNLSSGTVLVGPGAAGEIDGFCFLSSGCESDGEIVFSTAVSNLKFDSDGFNAGDSVTVSAFNGATLLGSVVLTVDGNHDLSAFGTITRLFFDDSSTGAGLGYSTFEFDAAAAAVPLPAALPLFATGLAAFGLMGWRKRRKAPAA